MKELITRIEELAVQVAGAQLQIDKSEAESRELGRELGKARQKMMELVNERDHALARVPTESWAEENKRLAAQSEDLLGVLERRELLIKSLNDEITKRDHELRAHEKELAEQRLEREQMQNQISELRTERDRIREISKSLVPKSALKQAVQEAAELRSELVAQTEELRAHEKELAEQREEIRAIIETATYFGMTSDEGVGNFIKRKCIESEDVRDEIIRAETNLELVRRECEQIRREVPLESTREGLKNAVAKLQEVNAQLDSAKGEAEEWLKQCHAARRQRDEVKAEARKETQRLSDLCAELQSKYESILTKTTDLGSYAMTLGRKEGEPIEMFMERQALRLAALETTIAAAKCDELAKATARIKPLEALYKTLKGWQENDHIIGYGLTIDTAINKATEALSQLTA